MQHVYCFIFAMPLKRVSFVAINMSTTTERQECGHNGKGWRGGWGRARGWRCGRRNGGAAGRRSRGVERAFNSKHVSHFVLSLWLLPSVSRFLSSHFFLCINALQEIINENMTMVKKILYINISV